MTPRRASMGAIISGSGASKSTPSSSLTSSPRRVRNSASPPTGCTELPPTSIVARSTYPPRPRRPDGGRPTALNRSEHHQHDGEHNQACNDKDTNQDVIVDQEFPRPGA